MYFYLYCVDLRYSQVTEDLNFLTSSQKYKRFTQKYVEQLNKSGSL